MSFKQMLVNLISTISEEEAEHIYNIIVGLLGKAF